MAMNFEQARQNMVENQVRPWDVLDARVLDALAQVRREEFVPPQYRQLAFADACLPIGHGQVMMKPVIEGRVLQALDLKPTDRVLEIGTGSGFLAACMAQLCAHVTSIDLQADFTAAARARLDAAGVANVDLVTGDAINGWQPQESFEAIVVTGAVWQVPPRFLGWLKPGGRLLAIRGESPAQQAVLLTQAGAGGFREEYLFETDLPYMAHAEPPRRFVF
ncbi:protein-L-isoaspartate O-methyltransferase family protein [Frateuria hangzhouensis]|uniref:protein-L-isoaspartate O-methyltransferase family protein n=1 Tax=Frateuria hangzhouensis TaxID=2995589 RepID=UPI002260D7A3|nr:protein-L-isoaspartate O-methyltransferase [Frateuria sp. STR12]MCX7514447.1 protein-L-isoaspartate O-methyltransferase [Frateuria sp. STR12]